MVSGGQTTHLFSGIDLSSPERKKLFAINTRYNEKIDLLRKNSPTPQGPIDASTLAQLRTLRTAQFAEWRGAMTTSHALLFDRNKQLVDADQARVRAAFPTYSQR